MKHVTTINISRINLPFTTKRLVKVYLLCVRDTHKKVWFKELEKMGSIQGKVEQREQKGVNVWFDKI